MVAYVDTSILVAALSPREPEHLDSASFFEGYSQRKIVSPLVMAELTSVASRRGLLRLSSKARRALRGLTWDEIPLAIAAYVMQRFRLEVADFEHRRVSTPFGPMDRLFEKALAHTPHLRLQALDVLHVAYAACLREDGLPIRAIITADGELLAEAAVIQRLTGIAMAGPKAALNR